MLSESSVIYLEIILQSGGAAFSSNNFLDAKSNQKKQFVQVAAKRIADSLVNVEFEKDCSCLYEYGMIGRSKCKIVGRKEVPVSNPISVT